MPSESTESDSHAAIDLQEDAGIAYWRREFGCSADELLAAMESVGTDAFDVAQFLAAGR
ncbi:MAG: DUF3606 domain-containing protein [Burkholderiaceae bacterium]